MGLDKESLGFIVFKVLVVLLAFTVPVSPARSGLTTETEKKLEYAEALYGAPFFITSGFRDKETNTFVGGAINSKHLKGEAVDIRMPASSSLLAKLVWALTLAEFGGIGVYKTHVHADTRKENIFWRG